MRQPRKRESEGISVYLGEKGIEKRLCDVVYRALWDGALELKMDFNNFADYVYAETKAASKSFNPKFIGECVEKKKKELSEGRS